MFFQINAPKSRAVIGITNAVAVGIVRVANEEQVFTVRAESRLTVARSIGRSESCLPFG